MQQGEGRWPPHRSKLRAGHPESRGVGLTANGLGCPQIPAKPERFTMNAGPFQTSRREEALRESDAGIAREEPKRATEGGVCSDLCVHTTARLSSELHVCKLHVPIHKPETLCPIPSERAAPHPSPKFPWEVGPGVLRGTPPCPHHIAPSFLGEVGT